MMIMGKKHAYLLHHRKQERPVSEGRHCSHWQGPRPPFSGVVFTMLLPYSTGKDAVLLNHCPKLLCPPFRRLCRNTTPAHSVAGMRGEEQGFRGKECKRYILACRTNLSMYFLGIQFFRGHSKRPHFRPDLNLEPSHEICNFKNPNSAHLIATTTICASTLIH